MKVFAKDLTGPVSFKQLPQVIQGVCNSLLDGLKAALNDNLFGIYLYGAMVFPETRYVQDIDFHVIVRRKLSADEKEAIQKLHNLLAVKYPQFKNELDGYYILLSDAQQISTPWHQIYPDLPDESWPLHIAHMRAGYCIVLCGPEPGSFLPEPTWDELVVGLEASLKHTLKYLDLHPDYCMLNFCRLLYSFNTKDVVISKRSAAEWTIRNYPDRRHIVEAALRVFERDGKKEDRQILKSEVRKFYQFVCSKIEKSSPNK